MGWSVGRPFFFLIFPPTPEFDKTHINPNILLFPSFAYTSTYLPFHHTQVYFDLYPPILSRTLFCILLQEERPSSCFTW